MKKRLLSFLILCLLILPTGVFCLCRFAEARLIAHIPSFFQDLHLSSATLSSSPPNRFPCLFDICIHIPQVTLHQDNADTKIGDVTLKIPFRWPFKLTFATSPDSPWQMDLDISRETVTVRKAQGTIASFLFSAKGSLDFRRQKGELTLKTIGLKSFLQPLLSEEAKPLSSLMTRDTPQTFTLSPQQGRLTVNGLPVFTLPSSD